MVAQEENIEKLIEWSKEQPGVRAVILTSSRAIPNGAEDIFSDYDVILALQDVRPYFEKRIWLEELGYVLVLFRDPLETKQDGLESGYVVQFEDGLKIDFSLWEVEILRRIVAAPELPPEFDAGYRILIDKDHLTEGIKPATYHAYIPKPPSEVEYQERIEMFFLDAIYVAKFLWRDDLMAAKYILETFVKDEHLRPMLEWHLEIEHGWSVKPGPYGRRLKKWLRPDLWKELESTYCGPNLEENWGAIFRTIALMRKTAVEVGEKLGFAYPYTLEKRVMAHLRRIKNLEKGADQF